MKRGIAALLMMLALSVSTSIFANSSEIVLGQLRYRGGRWNPRPNSVRPLMNFVASHTSIEPGATTSGAVAVDPGSKELFNYPFVLWLGDQSFDALSVDEIDNLRRYLRFGGFLLVDDAQGSKGFGFEASVRRELGRLFPEAPLHPLPKEHAAFRSFYLLDGSPGRLATGNDLESIEVQGRTVVVLSHNDLLGAWARDAFGNWDYEVRPGGEAQRQKAFRLGVNLLMYALCDDYKKDALHVDYIMKRRRSP